MSGRKKYIMNGYFPMFESRADCARTLRHRLVIIRPVTICKQIIFELNSCLELLPQEVALVEEKNNWDAFEELV
jgi:hypothetical protein